MAWDCHPRPRAVGPWNCLSTGCWLLQCRTAGLPFYRTGWATCLACSIGGFHAKPAPNGRPVARAGRRNFGRGVESDLFGEPRSVNAPYLRRSDVWARELFIPG